jgi:hypothetical protein
MDTDGPSAAGAATTGARLCEPQQRPTLPTRIHSIRTPPDWRSCCGSQTRAPMRHSTQNSCRYCVNLRHSITDQTAGAVQNSASPVVAAAQRSTCIRVNLCPSGVRMHGSGLGWIQNAIEMLALQNAAAWLRSAPGGSQRDQHYPFETKP